MITDKSNLTIRQRMNLASWRIKTAHLKGEFGDHIQFGDTEEDIIKQKGVMSIPLSLLPPGKSPNFKFVEKRFDKDGLLLSARTPEEQEEIQGTISLLELLEEEADRVTGVKREEDNPKQDAAVLSALAEETIQKPIKSVDTELGRVVDKLTVKSSIDDDIAFLNEFLNSEC